MQVSPKVKVWLGDLDLQDRVGGRGYRTTDLTGWWEQAPSTGQVVQRPAADGGWLSKAHPMGRHLVAKGSIRSGSHEESEAMLEALIRALPVDETTPLVVDEGAPRHLLVRQEDQPLYVWETDTHVTFDVQMHSGMAHKLSGRGTGPSRSETVGLPTTQGGRRRPYHLPSAIGAVVVTGSVGIDTPGTAGPAVVVQFNGPVSRPAVRTADGQLQWFDLDVLAGQSLVVDQLAHTVMLNGVDRGTTMRGGWLTLGPGGSTLLFDAASYNEDASMTISWFDSWK